MKKRRPDLVALDAITDLVLAHRPAPKAKKRKARKKKAAEKSKR
jgi:hypothetical protein